MSISLNDHERRIKDFEGKIPDIENRIDNLVSTAKDWAIVTTSTGSVSGRRVTYTIPEKYANEYDFVVVSGVDFNTTGAGAVPPVGVAVSRNSFSGFSGKVPNGQSYTTDTLTVTFTKSGTTITATASAYHGYKDYNFNLSNTPITVILYK